jgi:hypothetical protein
MSICIYTQESTKNVKYITREEGSSVSIALPMEKKSEFNQPHAKQWDELVES